MENLQGKNFVLSYSGGKDSILALHRAIKSGMIPQKLIITYNTDMDRSWFHGIPEPLLNMVSHCLHIPISIIRTSGDAYQENFIHQLQAEKEQGAEICVFGDIDIKEHREWCSNVCQKSGLRPLFPLWQESREKLVREFISEGYTAHITVLDTNRLTQKHLGMILTEEVLSSIEENGADICGENGEYHTFVSNGPIFFSPVPVSFGKPQIRGNYAVLPLLPDSIA